jgi:hypothetical protein
MFLPMFFGMRHHCRSGYESFAANLASVRSLTGVQAFVDGHRRELGERLSAKVATRNGSLQLRTADVANLPVGSLASVRPPVTPQSVSSGESFAAHLAHVGLLPRVHGRVDPQIDLSQEAFPANLKNQPSTKIQPHNLSLTSQIKGFSPVCIRKCVWR